jgi:5-formyltetrahydrofolate cyclo-ligase
VPERAVASARLVERLAQAPWFATASAILFFAPLPDEPDIWPLLESALADRRFIALPRYDSREQEFRAARITNPATDIANGRFGIREPSATCPEAPLNRLDLVLVPGVAFDTRGWRLGRGKGFYDRLLSQVCGKTCGVAFDEQIVEAIPAEPHDVRLNCILTPTRLIET